MTFRIPALAAALALAAAPAIAAPHHGSTASSDNMADQLNGTSLSDSQSGTAYTPTHMTETHSRMQTRMQTRMHGKAMRHMAPGASDSVSPANGDSTSVSSGQGAVLKQNHQIQENGGTQVQPPPAGK